MAAAPFLLLTGAVAAHTAHLLARGRARTDPDHRLIRAQTLAFVAALVGLALVTYLAVTSIQRTEGFTEFYLLGPDGMAATYPWIVAPGDSVTVVLSLVNLEGRSTSYQVEVAVGGTPVRTVRQIVTEDGGRWEAPLTVEAPRGPGLYPVDFVLYQSTSYQPYRRLRLWLEVQPRAYPALKGPQQYLLQRASPARGPGDDGLS